MEGKYTGKPELPNADEAAKMAREKRVNLTHDYAFSAIMQAIGHCRNECTIPLEDDDCIVEDREEKGFFFKRTVPHLADIVPGSPTDKVASELRLRGYTLAFEARAVKQLAYDGAAGPDRVYCEMRVRW